MAQFLRCNAKMRKSADLREEIDQAKRMEELGLKYTPPDAVETFNPICVDLDRIVTYMHHYDIDEEEVSGCSEISLEDGQYLVIDVDFQKLDKMLRGVDKPEKFKDK